MAEGLAWNLDPSKCKGPPVEGFTQGELAFEAYLSSCGQGGQEPPGK
jgi:hypothetical protein